VTAPAPVAPRGGSLRTLWRSFGDHGRALRAAVALRMLASLAMTVPVVAVAWVVERIRAGALTGSEALLVSAVVVASVVVQYGLWYASNHFAWVRTFHAVGDGRIAALRHVQSLPVGEVSGRRTGDVGAVLGADYEQVAVFAHNGLMTLVGGAVVPVITVAGLAFVDPLLALATGASILAAVPVFVGVNRSFVRQALARADTLAEANGRIVEYVQGVATARSFNRVGAALGWYRDAVARMRKVNDDLAVRITPLAYLAIGTAFLGVPLVIAVVGYQLLGGRVDGLTAVVFLVLVLRVYAPLVSVAIEVEGLRLTDAALTRIRRLHALVPQRFPDRTVAEPDGHDLTVDAVTFGYDPAAPVLRDVTLTAPAGAVTAVVGPSGAGKSTLLALAARFHDPDRGEVRLGGVPLPDLTAEQLRRAVTVVFQDVYLFAGTVRDNIAFGAPGVDDAAVEAAARAAHCHDFVTALPDGYDTWVGEGGLTLSGGERQRVSIARAILKDSPVVLLDEATAALDPLTERDVQRGLAALSRGRTTVVVAHRLSTVRTADRIVVLDGGRVAQCGTHDELVADPAGRYARLWADRERAVRWRLTGAGARGAAGAP
jgi:ATP-binding cassette subfamily B protein